MKVRVNPRPLAVASVLIASLSWVNAQQRSSAPVAIDPDDIGGVVASLNGPEAGVWVIAETAELPPKFARIVVTDDQCSYVRHDRQLQAHGCAAQGVRGLDRSRRGGRVSSSAAASGRPRAQPRDLDVGLGAADEQTD